MNQYWAYGLGMHSELILPELVAAEGVAPDVVIRLGQVEHTRSERCTTGSCFHLSTREACFLSAGLGSFLVHDGAEIVVEPFPGVDEQLIRLPLLGTMLAILLYQRGFLVLHGSAVAIGDQAVVFVGPKGRGKSTTAAMLYGRGHRILADDVVAVRVLRCETPMVVPGFPQLKLWPEAAACVMGKESETLPQLVSGYDKRSRRIGHDFSQKAVPLGWICALAEGPTPELKLLGPQNALIQLIANTYVARYGKELLHGEEAGTHLSCCTHLAAQVPVFRLERPNSLSVLADTARLVEDYAGFDSRISL